MPAWNDIQRIRDVVTREYSFCYPFDDNKEMVRARRHGYEEVRFSNVCCLYLTDSVGMVVLIDGQVKETSLVALDAFPFCLWQRLLHQADR